MSLKASLTIRFQNKFEEKNMNLTTLLGRQFTLNSRLYVNVLDGISEKEGLYRIDDKTNHLNWIAGHLLAMRCRSLNRSGVGCSATAFAAIYSDMDAPPPANRMIDTGVQYPPLSELLLEWQNMSEAFIQSVLKLPEDLWNKDIGFVTPIDGRTLIDSFAFTALHESFHIGQMSIIRKALGKPAMSYK
jgi:DinB superfamily